MALARIFSKPNREHVFMRMLGTTDIYTLTQVISREAMLVACSANFDTVTLSSGVCTHTCTCPMHIQLEVVYQTTKVPESSSPDINSAVCTSYCAT